MRALGGPHRSMVASRRPPVLALAASLAIAFVGLVPRSITARAYNGPPEQGAFNELLFERLGSYSDITSLYFRYRMWEHPAPYFDYTLEYPVLTNAFIWLASTLTSDVVSYLYVTAAVLFAALLGTVWLVARFTHANVWLLALSPALALHVVLNWDVLAVLPLVASLLLFIGRRDGAAGALLALAACAKLFPVVVLPLMIVLRLAERRTRASAAIVASFAAVSAAANAPFAIEPRDGGIAWRESWLAFFRFNQERPREMNLWNLLDGFGMTTADVNAWTAVLLVAGIAAAAVVAVLAMRRGATASELIVPLTVAVITWAFFINKVYSPQYSLWVIALVACAGAPVALAVALSAADLAYFTTSFTSIYLSGYEPAGSWAYAQVLVPSMVVREAVLLGVIAWAVAAAVTRRSPSAPSTTAGDPAAAVP